MLNKKFVTVMCHPEVEPAEYGMIPLTEKGKEHLLILRTFFKFRNMKPEKQEDIISLDDKLKGVIDTSTQLPLIDCVITSDKDHTGETAQRFKIEERDYFIGRVKEHPFLSHYLKPGSSEEYLIEMNNFLRLLDMNKINHLMIVGHGDYVPNLLKVFLKKEQLEKLHVERNFKQSELMTMGLSKWSEFVTNSKPKQIIDGPYSAEDVRDIHDITSTKVRVTKALRENRNVR